MKSVSSLSSKSISHSIFWLTGETERRERSCKIRRESSVSAVGQSLIFYMTLLSQGRRMSLDIANFISRTFPGYIN